MVFLSIARVKTQLSSRHRASSDRGRQCRHESLRAEAARVAPGGHTSVREIADPDAETDAKAIEHRARATREARFQAGVCGPVLLPENLPWRVLTEAPRMNLQRTACRYRPPDAYRNI